VQNRIQEAEDGIRRKDEEERQKGRRVFLRLVDLEAFQKRKAFSSTRRLV